MKNTEAILNMNFLPTFCSYQYKFQSKLPAFYNIFLYNAVTTIEGTGF